MKNPASKADKIIYIIPAGSCCVAILLGLIPCLLCLDGTFFAQLSFIVFIISILFHIYIIIRWQRFASHSPVAYAIVQPFNHLIIMCFALAVGATDVCDIPIKNLRDRHLMDYDLRYTSPPD